MPNEEQINLAEIVAQAGQADRALEVPPDIDAIAVSQGSLTPQETGARVRGGSVWVAA
jgi:hypothetical protein